MKQCWPEGALRAYLDGELPPEAMRSVAAHLDECPECGRLHAEMSVRASFVSGLMDTLATPLAKSAPKRAAVPASDSRSCSRSSCRMADMSKSSRSRGKDRRSGYSSREFQLMIRIRWRGSYRRRRRFDNGAPFEMEHRISRYLHALQRCRDTLDHSLEKPRGRSSVGEWHDEDSHR